MVPCFRWSATHAVKGRAVNALQMGHTWTPDIFEGKDLLRKSFLLCSKLWLNMVRVYTYPSACLPPISVHAWPKSIFVSFPFSSSLSSQQESRTFNTSWNPIQTLRRVTNKTKIHCQLTLAHQLIWISKHLDFKAPDHPAPPTAKIEVVRTPCPPAWPNNVLHTQLDTPVFGGAEEGGRGLQRHKKAHPTRLDFLCSNGQIIVQ